MCVAAMSAKAQVLTSETVNNVYEEVSNKDKSDFVFNAERTGNDITTMYVYKKDYYKDMVTLKPQKKYEYTYASDGTLTSKTTYCYTDNQTWECDSRYDYILSGNKYYTEYSRFNKKSNSFDQPTEKMIYSLMPDKNISNVSCYHRDRNSDAYQMVNNVVVNSQSMLIAKK